MIAARPPRPERPTEPREAPVALLPVCGASIASFVACTTFARALGLSVVAMVTLSTLSFAIYALALWRAVRRD